MMYRFKEGTAVGPTWQPQDPGTGFTWQPDWYSNMWMSCPKCGKLVQWGSVYCPNCGERMIEEVMEKDKLEQIVEKLDEILKELKKE